MLLTQDEHAWGFFNVNYHVVQTEFTSYLEDEGGHPAFLRKHFGLFS